MTAKTMHQLLHYFIALVWTGNGLFCKVLNGAPRHQQIIGQILGDNHAFFFTKAIGTAEILMAIWILSRIQSRWNAILQIIIVIIMNIIEFFEVPTLLLWGKFNIIFALLFVFLIYYNEFVLKHAITTKKSSLRR